MESAIYETLESSKGDDENVAWLLVPVRDALRAAGPFERIGIDQRDLHDKGDVFA
jgi:hypothetical protein